MRCASPSRGTLLAAENIDIFLSVLTNLVGLIPGVGGTPLYEVTKRIALEIIKNRTVPSLVPGLEAMIPKSPLVALLNNLTDPAAGAMGVIAGDIQGGNWLKRIGVFASDHIVYEARDNDLVVNTDAMFHGARREVVGYVFDQGCRRQPLQLFPQPAHPCRSRRVACGATQGAAVNVPRGRRGRARASTDAAFDADTCRCRPADRLRPSGNHGLAPEHRRP